LLFQILFLNYFLKQFENEKITFFEDSRNNSFKMFKAKNINIEEDNILKRITGVGKKNQILNINQS